MKKKLFLLPLFALGLAFTSCSDDDNEPLVETKEEISTFTDVELKLVDSDNDDYGIAFSSKTGKTYKYSEISKENIADIDLVSFANKAFIAFDSPDENRDINQIDGVKSTKIQITGVEMTSEEFDAIKDGTMLKDLKVIHDKESVQIDYRGIILFETAEGKKGALKVKKLNAQRILFDVVVMN